MTERTPIPPCVLMTTDTVGGVWNYSVELCAGLVRAGAQVVLATMGGHASPAQRSELAGMDGVTLVESRFALEWMDDPWADVAAAGDWLLGLQAQFSPEVIHLNGYAHAALPWHAPVLVVGHSCVCSWWQAVKREPAPARWDRYRTAVREGLAAADVVVAPSRAMLAALEDLSGPISEERGRVIYNGRDPQKFASGGDRSHSHKEPFILSVGRLWDEAKNAAALAAVAPSLPWPVVLAGDATAPDGRTQALANVQCLGRCDPARLSWLYAKAAIYALPARYEPFGLSVLEAALSGCALVLGDIPSLRELWADAAEFVPPDDTKALGETLRGLIEQPQRLAALAGRARTRARGFTAQAMVRSYLSTYAGMLRAVSARAFADAASP